MSWTVTRTVFPDVRTLPSSKLVTPNRCPVVRRSSFLPLHWNEDVLIVPNRIQAPARLIGLLPDPLPEASPQGNPPLPSQRAHHRRVGFDSVPQVLQSQIFVGGVLIVVVINDRKSNYGNFKNVGEQINRDAATHHR
jgi:hypothetical protein